LPEFITQNFLINYALLFWENPGESGRFWENLGDSGKIWEILGESWRFWEILGDSGRILEILGRFCKIELKKQLFL
jgi:hypothetical protein